MKEKFKQEVRARTESRAFLIPIFHDVHDIARRVHEYDPSFFVVFNRNTRKFEIHSLDYPGLDTKSTTIPFPELDARTLRHLWENDIRVHGEDIFRRLELGEEKARIRAERDRKNFTQDFAKEHQSLFAKDAWSA